jgi:hypothetical protein
MDLETTILLAGVIGIFILFPAIGMAMDSKTPTRDFFIGALIVPVVGTWAGAALFLLEIIPDSIMDNTFLGFAAFTVVFMGWPIIGAVGAIRILTRVFK